LPPGFEPGSTPHTLLLWLHGGPDDSSYLNRELRPIIEAAWERKELPPLVVAVPSARRSFYMDYRDGTEKWESLILKEVIPALRKKYGLRKDKGGTLIGGYSMGGMGSLRMAFKHPERFGAVAAIAPAIEPVYQFEDIQPRDREYRSDAVYERIYGKPVDHDFWQANHPPTLARDRARQIEDSELKVYIEVGNADELGLFRGGEFLHDTLLQKNVSHEYRLVHGAGHGGDTLPARLADAVRFLGRVSRGVDAHGRLRGDSAAVREGNGQ
jgi:S-formylglutathione hydrolase